MNKSLSSILATFLATGALLSANQMTNGCASCMGECGMSCGVGGSGPHGNSYGCSTSCSTSCSTTCAMVTTCAAPQCIDPGTSALVEMLALPEAAPAPVGGSLLDGTYILTALSFYTGAGGVSGPQQQSAAWVIVVANGTFASHLESKNDSASGSLTLLASGTVSAGTLLEFDTCGDTERVNMGFTATPGQLFLYDSAGTIEYAFDHTP